MIFDLLVAGAFALATLRRYSVVQIVTFLFILNSGLNSVSGVCEQPIPVECNTTEPWLRPCGTTLTMTTNRQQQQRHPVHRSLKKVRMKMRIAYYSYTCFKKERQEIYKDIKQKRHYKFNWLPKEQLMWYCNKVLCLKKDEKPQHLLPYLYDNLQRLAITFYELEKFHLNSSVNLKFNVDIVHTRDWMIDVTFNQILQMLCEVENAMYNLQIELPPPHNATIIESEFWSKEGGITQMLVQDWGVLKIYENFLYDWSSGLRNALNATLSNTCETRSLNGTYNENPKRRCVLKKKSKKLLRMKKRTKMMKKKQYSHGRNSSLNRITRKRLLRTKKLTSKLE